MNAPQKSKSPAATGLSANKSYLLHFPIVLGKEQYEFMPRQLQTGNYKKTNRSSLFIATATSNFI